MSSSTNDPKATAANTNRPMVTAKTAASKDKSKLVGQNYTTPDLDRQGYGAREVRGGFSRRGDAVREAAAQPLSACQGGEY
jgi:hypothetical protein